MMYDGWSWYKFKKSPVSYPIGWIFFLMALGFGSMKARDWILMGSAIAFGYWFRSL